MKDFYKKAIPEIFRKHKDYEQNTHLGFRRTGRYLIYKTFKWMPSLFYEKLFTNSYLPFTVRNNLVIMAGILVGFKGFIIYKSRDSETST